MNCKALSTPRFDRFHFYLALLMLLFLLALPGCKKSTPEAKPSGAQGLPAANVPAANVPAANLPAATLPAAETANPAVFTATAPAEGAQPGAGGAPAAAAAPSPTGGAGAQTGCAYPPGWVVYTILPGDTLSALAYAINSSVEEIQRGNCLEDERLVAYETLHLPRRPPMRAAGGATQVVIAETEDPCASIFSCANPNLPSITVEVQGGAGDADPCDDGRTGPRVNVDFRFIGEERKVEIGYGDYFFACGFDHPENLTARVTGPAGTEDLEVQGVEFLRPDIYYSFDAPKDQRIVAWYPACNLPEGPYTLYISDNVSEKRQNGSATINLKKNEYATIMVKPMMVKAGTSFDIFYCGFPESAGVHVDFFRVTEKISADGTHTKTYDHIKSFDVTVNNAGWHQQDQSVPPGTAAGMYAFKYSAVVDTVPQTITEYFWVIP